MGRPKTRLPDVRNDPVRQQIEHWRRTRTKRSPMPEPLWRLAVGLARKHGVYATAQALRLSYDSLRTRAEAAGAGTRRGRERGRSRTTFVELGATMQVGVVCSGPIVEVTGPQGQRMTVRLRGGELDVAELIRECWRGRA